MNPFLAYVSLYASMSLVGTYVAFSKVLVTTFPVLLLASMRFGIAALAMIPWLKPEPGQAALTSSSKQLIFWQSFFGNFCFSIFMLFGMVHTSAMAAGILMSLLPVCVTFLSWLWLNEKLNARIFIALFLAVIAILFINLAKLNSTDTRENPSFLGNILLLAAVLCEAIYVVIGKKLTENVSAKRISALTNLVGLSLMLPFGLWAVFGQTTIFDFTAVPLNSWLLLIFYALAASQWSVWLWMRGLKYVRAMQAAVFTVALPVASTLVGVFFLNEKFLLSHAIAFSCAVFSLLLMGSVAKTV